LSRDPGRIIVLKGDDILAKTEVGLWQLSATGEAKLLGQLPPEIFAVPQRVGQGDQVTYWVPSKGAGQDGLMRTFTLKPDGKYEMLKDRPLPMLGRPFVHLVESDQVLVGLMRKVPQTAQIIVLESKGGRLELDTELPGEIKEMASDGRYVAAVSQHGYEPMLFSPLHLYELKDGKLLKLGETPVEPVVGKESSEIYITGLSVTSSPIGPEVSVGVEDRYTDKSAILNYQLEAGKLRLKQTITGGKKPLPFVFTSPTTAFQHNGAGELRTYLREKDGWRQADQRSLGGAGYNTTATIDGRIYFASNNANDVVAVELGDDGKISEPLVIPEFRYKVPEREPDRLPHGVRFALD
jgi:hypothetical protein